MERIVSATFTVAERSVVFHATIHRSCLKIDVRFGSLWPRRMLEDKVVVHPGGLEVLYRQQLEDNGLSLMTLRSTRIFMLYYG